MIDAPPHEPLKGKVMFALTASNDTLIGVACVVIILCGLLFIFGRGWRR